MPCCVGPPAFTMSSALQHNQHGLTKLVCAALRACMIHAPHLAQCAPEGMPRVQMQCRQHGCRRYLVHANKNATGMAQRFRDLHGLQLLLLREVDSIAAGRRQTFAQLQHLTADSQQPTDDFILQARVACGSGMHCSRALAQLLLIILQMLNGRGQPCSCNGDGMHSKLQAGAGDTVCSYMGRHDGGFWMEAMPVILPACRQAAAGGAEGTWA